MAYTIHECNVTKKILQELYINNTAGYFYSCKQIFELNVNQHLEVCSLCQVRFCHIQNLRTFKEYRIFVTTSEKQISLTNEVNKNGHTMKCNEGRKAVQ